MNWQSFKSGASAHVALLPYLTIAFISLSAMPQLATAATIAQTAPMPAATEGQAPENKALQSKVNSLSSALTSPADRDAVKTFYEARGYRPVWTGRDGLTPAGIELTAELANADDWGLQAADFELDSSSFAHSEWSPEQVADAEFEITVAILTYARQARGGRISEPDRLLSTYLDRRPSPIAPAQVLRSVGDAAKPALALHGLHPKHEQFLRLRALYADLRQELRIDPNAMLPPKGPVLLPGVTHPDVAILRRRLDVPASVTDEMYDAALVTAVKKFQDEASLRADGNVGGKTRAALRDSGNRKLASIQANMEQWRWMPDDLGQQHLFVNIPAFSVALVRDNRTVLEERVIVGKSETQTPIFSKAVATIVLNPSWNLPDSIKLEKLLAAQRNGTSIESEGYEIRKAGKIVDSMKVNWNKANLSSYVFSQPSGDGNALGDVKFLFPNKHSVYLHDTPVKSLFSSPERLFSHGCIRLRNPLTLAQKLIDADKGSATFNVKQTIKRGKDNTLVTLANPLPIHVAYFTVWVDDDGKAKFLGDPYGHEERITLALQQMWKDIDRGDDHLAAVDTDALKNLRFEALRPAPRRSNVRRALRFDAPSGLLRAGSPPKSWFSVNTGGGRSRRDTSVGELMRSALSN